MHIKIIGINHRHGTSDSKPMSAATASAAAARLPQCRRIPLQIEYNITIVIFCIPVSLINAADNVQVRALATRPRWPNSDERRRESQSQKLWLHRWIILWFESLKLFFDSSWVLSFDWNYASKFMTRFPLISQHEIPEKCNEIPKKLGKHWNSSITIVRVVLRSHSCSL